MAWQAACAQHQQAKQRLAEVQQKDGVVLADATFFAREHDKRHQATPWFPPAAQCLRDEVFISAIALHHAFIDAAVKPLRHNLGALMNAFTTQTLPGAEKQALLPDLWASLFLVVPLVSTTFASVNRMLGKLPLESPFPWVTTAACARWLTALVHRVPWDRCGVAQRYFPGAEAVQELGREPLEGSLPALRPGGMP